MTYEINTKYIKILIIDKYNHFFITINNLLKQINKLRITQHDNYTILFYIEDSKIKMSNNDIFYNIYH